MATTELYKLEAIIRPEKLDEVKEALAQAGFCFEERFGNILVYTANFRKGS